MLACVNMKSCCEKLLGVEECSKLEDTRATYSDPGIQERHPLVEVLHVGSEWKDRREAVFKPRLWDFVREKTPFRTQTEC